MIHLSSGLAANKVFMAVLLWLVAANIAGFLAMLADKRRSQAGLWRIPEGRLLGFALIGGCIGTLIAQQLLRHKTRKQPFRTYLIMIALFQIVGVMVVSTPAMRGMLVEVLGGIR